MLLKVLICCEFVFLSQAFFSQGQCEAIYEINGQEICVPIIDGYMDFYSKEELRGDVVNMFSQTETPIAYYLNIDQTTKCFNEGSALNECQIEQIKLFSSVNSPSNISLDEFELVKKTIPASENIDLKNIALGIDSLRKGVGKKAYFLRNESSLFLPNTISLFGIILLNSNLTAMSFSQVYQGNSIINVVYLRPYRNLQSFVNLKKQTKMFLNKFNTANLKYHEKIPNLHDGMKNLINNESIDQNDICASGLKATLMDSYGLEVSKLDAEAYCKCVFEGLASKDYGLDINKASEEQLINPNTPVYNEVAMGCLKSLFESIGILDKEDYQERDILGNEKISKVKILKDIDESLKLKITIGGIEKYFQYDTGASHLVIDEKMEQDLLTRNILRESDYLGSSNVTLADNTVVKCKVVNLSQIKIGDYFVNNVETLIVENGSFLCGLSLLEKFQSYKFNSNTNILTIQR